MESANKTRILIIGPYPPPLGGVTVECLTLSSCLSEYPERAVIDKFNTNSSVIRFFLQLPGLIFQILAADSLFIYGSHRRVSLFSIAFIPFCKLLGKRQVVKITGGNLWDYYQSTNRLLKFLLDETLFDADIVLLETKSLVNSFQATFPNVQWFPMTRLRSPEVTTPASSDGPSPKQNQCVGDISALRVVFLGHINESKGVPLLADVAEDLEGIQIDAFGEFQANGGVQLDSDFFQDRKIQYKGVVQPAELPRILENYDVLVLPTCYRGEGYPGVIIEAKRSGLAVVTTRWRSIPEIVDHNVNGLLVQPGSHDELANALRRLHSDRNLLSKLKIASYDSFDEYDCRHWGEILLEHLTVSRSP